MTSVREWVPLAMNYGLLTQSCTYYLFFAYHCGAVCALFGEQKVRDKSKGGEERRNVGMYLHTMKRKTMPKKKKESVLI